MTQPAHASASTADDLAAQGDVRAARALLEQQVLDAPDAAAWFKLASLRRATGAPRAALDAVHAGLTLDPLNFFGLFSRASLLEALGVDGCGEAYARALAQRPDGAFPPPLARMIDHAQQRAAQFADDREAQLLSAMAPAMAGAPNEDAQRLRRFCSNAVRKTRVYHSEPTHYAYPGLLEREFHDPAHFPWLADLEAATTAIQAECAAIIASRAARREPYVQYPAHEPLAQWRALNHNPDWTAIHLLRNGYPVADNASHCPLTMALLARLPQPDIPGCSPNAMFSLLAPDTHIPPHVGVTNTRLVCHLPLVVPAGCWFRVGAETRFWEEGRAFVFDDTMEHEARNPTDQLRVVLIFDVWHPGLSAIERDGTRALLRTDATSAALAL